MIRSVTLPGAEKGILFYLKPDFGKMFQHGIWEPIYAAMGQAFFTLSLVSLPHLKIKLSVCLSLSSYSASNSFIAFFRYFATIVWLI